MPLAEPINPGPLDWTGENPGILLKEREDGPWSALSLFFRVFHSPHGQGQMLLLYEKPDEAQGLPEVHNILMSDNEPMADYLKTAFIEKLGLFGGAAAYGALTHVPITSVRTTGDPCGSRYTEVVNGEGLAVELVWEQLGTPRALELPPELTGTKEHTMFSLLVESREAAIYVNGRRLPGKPVPREQAGLKTTTAFLYFSETWIFPPEG